MVVALLIMFRVCSLRLLAMGNAAAAGDVSSSGGATDAGFALRRYLAESVIAGSVNHTSAPSPLDWATSDQSERVRVTPRLIA